MSGLRPAALAALRRWRGPIAAAALAASALLLFGPAALRGAPVALGLTALALVVSLWLGRDALARLRLARAGGAGVVDVAEGRIAYFGPETGGVADLDALRTVEITAAAEWLLRPVDGPPLRIPLAAEGAAALPDAFAALPGFSVARAAEAAGRGLHAIVWRRGPDRSGPAPALDSPAAGSYISRRINPQDGP